MAGQVLKALLVSLLHYVRGETGWASVVQLRTWHGYLASQYASVRIGGGMQLHVFDMQNMIGREIWRNGPVVDEFRNTWHSAVVEVRPTSNSYSGWRFAKNLHMYDWCHKSGHKLCNKCAIVPIDNVYKHEGELSANVTLQDTWDTYPSSITNLLDARM